MSAEVKIPAVGESITSGLLSIWHKQDGEAVQIGEALLTLETDKVATEITAPIAGVLRIKVPAGTDVQIGDVVGSIDESAGAPAAKSETAPIAPLASPPAATPAPAHTTESASVPAKTEAPAAPAPAPAPKAEPTPSPA